MDDFLLPDEALRMQKNAVPMGTAPPSNFLLPGEQLATDRAGPVIRRAATENPDTVAKIRNLATDTGLPAPVVARNENTVRAQAAYDRIMQHINGSPALARNMANPDFAGIAHDDTENLAQISGALSQVRQSVTSSEFAQQVLDVKRKNPTFTWDQAREAVGNRTVVNNEPGGVRESTGPAATVESVLQGLATGFAESNSQVLQGIRQWAGEVLGLTTVADDATRKALQAKNAEFLATPVLEGALAKDLYSGAASILQVAPVLAVSIATANPALGLALMGVQQAAPAYSKYRARGGSIGEASLGATLEGGAEVAGELAPMGFLVNKIGRVGMTQFIAGMLGREIPSEIGTTIAQTATDTAIANPQTTWLDWAKSLPEDIRTTVVATVMQAGALAGAHGVLKKFELPVAKADERAKALTDLSNIVAASKVLERNPDDLKAFIDDAAQDGPVQNIFVPAAVFAQAAGDNLDVFKAAMPSVGAQMDEALATGGELVIPVGEFLVGVQGTGMEKTLIENARTAEDEPSKAEAAVFMQEAKAEFEAKAEAMLAKAELTDAQKESAATVEKELLAQLQGTNRFTNDVNAAKAKYAAAFFAQLAARRGTTAEQEYIEHPLDINAEALGGERVLDQVLDLNTPEFKKWFEGSKVVDAQGKPLVVYHGTTADFSAFNTQGLGAHFGTSEQSNQRLLEIGNRFTANKTFPVHLSIKNPLRLPDLGTWGFENVARELKKQGALTPADYDKAWNANDQENALREILSAKGYDGVVYENAVEGKGLSYIAFNPNQIKSIFNNRPTQRPNIFEQLHPGNLIVQHNLTVANLMHAARLGGIPVPSLAIVKADDPLLNFGEITLIGRKEMADPRGYARTRVFGADIYSPRYPRVEHHIEQSTFDRLRADFKGAEAATNSTIDTDAIQRKGAAAFENEPAVMWQFLTDRGVAPKVVMKEPIDPLTLERYRIAGLEPYFGNKDVQALQHDRDFQKKAYAIYKQDREKLGRAVEPFDALTDSVRRGLSFELAHAMGTILDSPKANPYATREALRIQVLADYSEEFIDYTQQLMLALDANERIFKGFTPAGKRRYVPHSLENVVKILKRDLRGGESMHNIYGVGQLRAKFTPQFKSMAAIRNAQHRLVSDEEFEAAKAEIEHAFETLSSALEPYYNSQNLRSDTVMALIEDTPKMGFARAAKEYGFEDVPADVREDVYQFTSQLANMPTEYFEAKILREVDIAEFKAAVVPESTPQVVIDLLEGRGLAVSKYKKDEAYPSKQGPRRAAIKAAAEQYAENVLFQETIDNETGQPDEAPPFFSALTQQIEKAKITVAPAEQWKKYIAGLASKGVKKEEIEWSGVMNALDIMENRNPEAYRVLLPDGAIAYKAATKEDADKRVLDLESLHGKIGYQLVKMDTRISKQMVLDYLDQNAVKVETIILGEAPKAGTDVAPYDEDEEDGNEITDDMVEERARQLWENDLPEIARQTAENDEYNFPGEPFLRLPDFKVVLLPPDMYRPGERWGVMRLDWGSVDDVADLEELSELYPDGPRAEFATNEEFDNEDSAAAWAKGHIKSQTGEGLQAYGGDPYFTVQFSDQAERGEDNGAYDSRQDAQNAGEQDSQQRIEWAIENYDDDYGWEDYTDEARRQLEEERDAPDEKVGVLPVRHKGSWQAENGRMYRELIHFVPSIDPYNASDSTHFQTDTEGRTIAWSRIKVHDDANGVPTLTIQEVQTQRGQAGRKIRKDRVKEIAKERGISEREASKLLPKNYGFEGYDVGRQDVTPAPLVEEVNAAQQRLVDTEVAFTNFVVGLGLPERYSPRAYPRFGLADAQAMIMDGGTPAAVRQVLQDAFPRMTALFDAFSNARTIFRNLEQQRQAATWGNSFVPDAPFIKDTQAWTTLALKRIVRWAVDNGITQVAWTPGLQQVDRYQGYLRQQIDEIVWSKVEGGIDIELRKHGSTVKNVKWTESELATAAGDAIAEQIINSPEQIGVIRGDNIKIDSLWPANYYGDENGKDAQGETAILPAIVNKLVRELGGTGIEPIAVSMVENARTHRQAMGFKITDAMAEKIRGGLPLFQGRRGQIAFGENMQATRSTITLLKNADLSTFLHEFAHFQLQVLADIASQENAPTEIKQDMDAILRWFGIKDLATWNAMTLNQKRPYHEQFARGGEVYLLEGKAPNTELIGVFARFRAWMINVYKTIQGIRAEYKAQTGLDLPDLTDEVRGVFDRMIATNEQIQAAEELRGYAPMFKSAEEMGATEAEWKAYQQLDVQAAQNAAAHLEAASMRDMAYAVNTRNKTIQRLTKDAEAKRAQVREEVTAEVRQEPVYAAQRWLRYGILPDGTQSVGAKLDLAALKEMYGEDPAVPWRYLPTGQNGMAGNEGLHPDQVAEMFGFPSGDALVRSILAADPEAARIEGETSRRMLERYGDLTDPQAIARAADRAVHNEVRARFIATELRALEKALGKKPTLARAAKEFARTIIARKKVRDIKPNVFAMAETRAGRAAEKAKSLTEKATEKRNQMVNHYAARAAYDALEEADKAREYLKRFDDPKVRKQLDIDFIEQIDGILERFDLRKLTPKEMDSRISLNKWIESRDQDAPALPEKILNEAFRKPYKELTMEELRGLVDSIKNIEAIGKRWKKVLTARGEREFKEVVDEIVSAVEANATKIVPPESSSDRGRLIPLTRWMRSFAAMHRKFASLIREMDGWKDGGVLWEYFSRSMNIAQDTAAVMNEAATIRLGEIFAPILKNSMGKMNDGLPYTREERIGLLLNMGNEVNQERVTTGARITPAMLLDLFKTLSPEEAKFAQDVWDYFESFRAQIAERERRLNGVEPKWVEAKPFTFTASNGEEITLRGGYYPIAYDPLKSERSFADLSAEVNKQLERGLYSRAQTAQGHLKARVESTGRELRLDFGNVIVSHVDKVIHDLAYREYLIDANKLLRAKPVEQAIVAHYGHEKLRQLKETLTDIAIGNRAMQDALDRVLNYVRTGATIAGLGWRVATSLLQPIGLTQSMVRIGTVNVLRGAYHWATDPNTSYARISELSPFMRLRGKTMQREISEIRNRVASGDSKIEASYFYLIQKAQLIADIPTWWGAYEKAMLETDTPDEARAIALADQAVRDAQGAGQVGDLAAIQRGSTVKRLLTNFYSFFNTTYQLNREAFGRTHFNKPGEVMLLGADLLLLNVIPAIMGSALSLTLAGDWDDPDKAARKLAAAQLSYLFGTMVGVRELGGVAQKVMGLQGPDYSGPAALRLFGAIENLGKQTMQGEPDEPFWKSLNTVGGLLLHYPSSTINSLLDGLHALATGKTQNPGALLVGSKTNN